MKIAIIVDNFPVFSETFIFDQALFLIRAGHEVSIFAARHPSDAIAPDDDEKKLLAGRVFYCLPASRSLAVLTGWRYGWKLVFGGWRELCRLFRYGLDLNRRDFLKLICWRRLFPLADFDIIHCHYGPNGVIGAYLKECGARGKLVVTFHGVFDVRAGLKKRGRNYRSLIKQADKIIAVSDYMRHQLRSFGFSDNQLVTVYCAINLKKFPFVVRTDRENAVMNMITVARLVEDKGLKYAIEACKMIRDSMPNLSFTYTIIGDGVLKKTLLKLIQRLNLTGVVSLVGVKNRDEVRDWLNQADVFLLSSLAEGAPMVVREAQAVGLPVVATKVDGVPELIMDGLSGFLVTSASPLAIKEKILYLFQQSAKRAAMGLAGRRLAEEKFDLNVVYRKLLEIYEFLNHEF